MSFLSQKTWTKSLSDELSFNTKMHSIELKLGLELEIEADRNKIKASEPKNEN